MYVKLLSDHDFLTSSLDIRIKCSARIMEMWKIFRDIFAIVLQMVLPSISTINLFWCSFGLDMNTNEVSSPILITTTLLQQIRINI